MKDLTARDLAFVFFAAACERKSRSSRRVRVASLIIDDTISFFDDPRLSPVVRRFHPKGVDPGEAEYREMFADTQAYLKAIAPLIKWLAET